MIIATSLFPSERPADNERFQRLFALWHCCVSEWHAGPIVVLTHAEHMPVPEGVQLVRFDLSALSRYMRHESHVNLPTIPGHGGRPHLWDVKGALVASFLREATQSILYLDTDAFPQRALEPALPTDRVMWQPPEIGPDVFAVRGMPVQHCCAGVMWFPQPAAFADIASNYFTAFTELFRSTPRHWLLEQRAWSVTRHILKGGILAREWNWLPHRKEYAKVKNAQPYVVHMHGPEKWKLPELAPSAASDLNG